MMVLRRITFNPGFVCLNANALCAHICQLTYLIPRARSCISKNYNFIFISFLLVHLQFFFYASEILRQR